MKSRGAGGPPVAQYVARRAIPNRSAMRARRSQAAQHMTAEKVWTRALPRSSQRPASGWSKQRIACSPGLETTEKGFVAPMGEPLIEEYMCRGEDRRTIHVVLDLPVGLIADAHRSHAPVSGQGRHLPLFQIGSPIDAIDRL